MAGQAQAPVDIGHCPALRSWSGLGSAQDLPPSRPQFAHDRVAPGFLIEAPRTNPGTCGASCASNPHAPWRRRRPRPLRREGAVNHKYSRRRLKEATTTDSGFLNCHEVRRVALAGGSGVAGCVGGGLLPAKRGDGVGGQLAGVAGAPRAGSRGGPQAHAVRGPRAWHGVHGGGAAAAGAGGGWLLPRVARARCLAPTRPCAPQRRLREGLFRGGPWGRHVVSAQWCSRREPLQPCPQAASTGPCSSRRRDSVSGRRRRGGGLSLSDRPPHRMAERRSHYIDRAVLVAHCLCVMAILS